MMIEAVQCDLEMDELLPKYVVNNGGDVTKTLSGAELQTLGNRVIKATNEAGEGENKIEPKRAQLAEKLFGKPETYMDVGKEIEMSINPGKIEKPAANTSTAKSTEEKGVGAGLKWGIVIVLSIVALSWGIWTAIGVFVLGAIIVGVLNK